MLLITIDPIKNIQRFMKNVYKTFVLRGNSLCPKISKGGSNVKKCGRTPMPTMVVVDHDFLG